LVYERPRAEANKRILDLRASLLTHKLSHQRWPGGIPEIEGVPVESRGPWVETLLAIPNQSGPAPSPRVVHLSAPKASAMGRPGLWKDPVTSECELRDPWGNYFQVYLDFDDDGLIKNIPTHQRDGIVIMSFGRDGKPDVPGGPKDDVWVFYD